MEQTLIKKILITSISGILISSSIAASAAQMINESIIHKINNEISDATNACDFNEATKRYFNGTKFFYYEVVDGVESAVEQSYDEVIPSIKEAMTACDLTLDKEETISETVTISPSGITANFKSEAIHFLKTTDGRLFKSHNKSKTMFGIYEEKIVILESHYKGLSFEEVNNTK